MLQKKTDSLTSQIIRNAQHPRRTAMDFSSAITEDTKWVSKQHISGQSQPCKHEKKIKGLKKNRRRIERWIRRWAHAIGSEQRENWIGIEKRTCDSQSEEGGEESWEASESAQPARSVAWGVSAQTIPRLVAARFGIDKLRNWGSVKKSVCEEDEGCVVVWGKGEKERFECVWILFWVWLWIQNHGDAPCTSLSHRSFYSLILFPHLNC